MQSRGLTGKVLPLIVGDHWCDNTSCGVFGSTPLSTASPSVGAASVSLQKGEFSSIASAIKWVKENVRNEVPRATFRRMTEIAELLGVSPLPKERTALEVATLLLSFNIAPPMNLLQSDNDPWGVVFRVMEVLRVEVQHVHQSKAHQPKQVTINSKLFKFHCCGLP